MGKKHVAVSLRKPPPSSNDTVKAPEAIAVPEVVTAPEAPPSPPPPFSVVTRAGERKELTVYLPAALFRALSARCLESDRDMSNVVSELLEASLAASPTPVRRAEPDDVFSRARTLVNALRSRLAWALP